MIFGGFAFFRQEFGFPTNSRKVVEAVGFCNTANYSLVTPYFGYDSPNAATLTISKTQPIPTEHPSNTRMYPSFSALGVSLPPHIPKFYVFILLLLLLSSFWHNLRLPNWWKHFS